MRLCRLQATTACSRTRRTRPRPRCAGSSCWRARPPSRAPSGGGRGIIAHTTGAFASARGRRVSRGLLTSGRSVMRVLCWGLCLYQWRQPARASALGALPASLGTPAAPPAPFPRRALHYTAPQCPPPLPRLFSPLPPSPSGMWTLCVTPTPPPRASSTRTSAGC